MLRHLVLALRRGPRVVEVRPVPHEEIQRLEGLLDLALLLLGAALHRLPQRGLGEGHEVGEVLDLVLLDLHADVVDLLRGDQRGEPEDGGGLLLGHIAVPSALGVHEHQRHGLAVDLPDEGLGPDPDALGAVVHAALEPEAVLGAVDTALDGGAGVCHPGRQRVLLLAAALRRLCGRRRPLPSLGELLLVAQVPEEEVQEEGLPRAEGAHHGDHGDLVRLHGLQVLLQSPERILVHLDLFRLLIEGHQLKCAHLRQRGGHGEDGPRARSPD
mmetsp:Transcript_24566/g.70083  ORF Transcript_24566/g.70083 Transcript_24566/m.70083 type:complete len:271 (-) Transcript_24566:49-861(-)